MVFKQLFQVKINVGDTVGFKDFEFGEQSSGEIVQVLSDMDSYDDMRLKDGVPYYASKKLTATENRKRKKAKLSPLENPIYVPVKEKNMDSVFLELDTFRGKKFIWMNEVERIIKSI